jgi:hypothetical protein
MSVRRRLLSTVGLVAAVGVIVVTVVVLLMRPGPGSAPPEDVFARLGEQQAAPSPDQRPQVEVLNGCGIPRIAARVQEFLRERGYDVVNVENASGFDYEETIVMDRGGDPDVARAVARHLDTRNVIRQVRPDLVLQVTVILGRDYLSLRPFREGLPP